MAHEIKLDLYTVKIKSGKEKGINRFEKLQLKSGGENSFTNIFTEYIKSFNGMFWVQNISGKAITIQPSGAHFDSNQQIIYGQFEGGTTGLGSKIKKIDDASDATAFQVTTDDVSSIPYYFLLWLPNDSDLGLLLVQSFSSKSFSEVLKNHLKRFFNDTIKNVIISINEHIPQALEKRIKEDGAIKEIKLRRLKLPSTKAEKLLGLNYVEDTPITIEVKISGLAGYHQLQSRLKEMVFGKNTKVIELESLDEIGIDGNHETLFTFEHEGKIASGKFSENFKLSPSYYIKDSDIVRDKNNHVTLDSMHSYVLSFLEKMKTEIGYQKTK